MEIASILANVCLFLFSFLSYHFLKKKKKKKNRTPKHRAKLPPGSMGWPCVGETLQLYTQDPNVFFAAKQKRYGEVFKSHILGCPCVMLASPEGARFVLVTHAHLFKPTYPKSKEKMIGPSALFFHQGDYHNLLRRLLQTSLSPGKIRKLLPSMESFSFDVGILSIFGHLDSNYRQTLSDNYHIVDKGYNSFPAEIPGTAYYKALSARKRLNKILSEIICERKEKRLQEKDFLGQLLNFKNEKGEIITEDQIADNIIGVLFAAQDTTASVLTWILKYLHDDQKLLEAVKAEHMEIYEANERGKKPLTWAQTRSMPLTYKVILESLRVASIISFTFREAVVDVEYNGEDLSKNFSVMKMVFERCIFL
ncbi:CYTOCHROME P450 FAMILY ABA 8'-HYDROXYLASE [Salix viminalis]|uniref:CYTOCHROME P450 FAMILY ABA 8'-HYDROXYLASE n=1 Tax=Salix viminalis TaxID=40686 RepID=A0A9Q0QJE1_SALVM|nr:CYTOCHROME P450 FAMILY ABA 8'-HYDROXYLASE [Salix viminalis]